MFLFKYEFSFLWFTLKLGFVIYSQSRTKTTETAITFFLLIDLFISFRRSESAASLVAEVHDVHKAC